MDDKGNLPTDFQSIVNVFDFEFQVQTFRMQTTVVTIDAMARSCEQTVLPSDELLKRSFNSYFEILVYSLL